MWRFMAAGVCAALLGAPVAAADPPQDPLIGPAVEAEAAPAPPPPLDPFAATSAATTADPATTFSAMLANASPLEMANRGIGLSAPPPSDPMAPTNILMPQYYRMPSGDVASPYVLQTDAPPGPFERVNAWKGVHALAHGALGRMPRDELSQPLPGTAPPPGTNIPAGLEQYYIPPAPPAALAPNPDIVPVLPTPPAPPVPLP